MSPWQINQLGKAVIRGDVFAYPTDTIWGFGCHPLHESAVQRILQIKQRSVNKGLILLSSSLTYVEPFLSDQLDIDQIKRLGQIDSHPTTWLVEASENCPGWLCGQFTTIAIRLTSHPFVSALCDSIQTPLVSTSANRSGRPPVRNAIQARRQFATELDYIVEGFSPGSKKASKIKSLFNGKSIRA